MTGNNNLFTLACTGLLFFTLPLTFALPSSVDTANDLVERGTLPQAYPLECQLDRDAKEKFAGIQSRE